MNTIANVSRTHLSYNAGACVFCVTYPRNEGMSRSELSWKVSWQGTLRDTLAEQRGDSAQQAGAVGGQELLQVFNARH